MTADLWVVDTSVVVSGVITSDAQSPVATILNRMISAEMRFALCVELVAEYRHVLLRPHIRRIHGLDEVAVDQILGGLIENAVIVDISSRTENAPDPGDNHLWRLLAACSSSGLITGDKLLIKNPPTDTHVLTARDYAKPTS